MNSGERWRLIDPIQQEERSCLASLSKEIGPGGINPCFGQGPNRYRKELEKRTIWMTTSPFSLN